MSRKVAMTKIMRATRKEGTFLFALIAAALLNPPVKKLQRALGWSRQALSAVLLVLLFGLLANPRRRPSRSQSAPLCRHVSCLRSIERASFASKHNVLAGTDITSLHSIPQNISKLVELCRQERKAGSPYLMIQGNNAEQSGKLLDQCLLELGGEPALSYQIGGVIDLLAKRRSSGAKTT